VEREDLQPRERADRRAVDLAVEPFDRELAQGRGERRERREVDRGQPIERQRLEPGQALDARQRLDAAALERQPADAAGIPDPREIPAASADGPAGAQDYLGLAIGCVSRRNGLLKYRFCQVSALRQSRPGKFGHQLFWSGGYTP
jgi:hypothetical protein